MMERHCSLSERRQKMILKFRSKAEMKFYHPLERFNHWPEDTFSFCPECGTDAFELLFENESDSFVRCRHCSALWITKTKVRSVHFDATLI
jgi:hypothetical protein